MTVTVTGANDAPVAVDDLATTPEDTAVAIAAATLVANDTDLDGDTLTVTAVGTARQRHGEPGRAATVTFTPAANYTGAASFEYTVSDGALTDTGLVTVTVTGANDAPVAVDDRRDDAGRHGGGDRGGDAAGERHGPGWRHPHGDRGRDRGQRDGELWSATAAMTFTPAANYTGAASFEYTVSDGALTDTGLVTVTVTRRQRPAGRGGRHVATTPEDTAVAIAAATLLANDTDLDGDTLSVTAVGTAVNGTVSLVSGVVTFTPAANYTGAASFEYTVSDGALTDTGLVTVTVTARQRRAGGGGRRGDDAGRHGGGDRGGDAAGERHGPGWRHASR